MPLASKYSSWLVGLGSTACVACSVYTSDLLVQDDGVKPGPSASTSIPLTSGVPSTRPSSSNTGAGTSTDPSSNAGSDASVDPSGTEEPPGSSDGGSPIPTSEPSGSTDGGTTDSGSMPNPTASTAASVPSATPPPDPTLIDDFEDGNNRILLRGGRTGYWFTSATDPDPEDDVFPITPTTPAAGFVVAPEPTGDANDTKKAAHVVASGISDDVDSHAELGVNFINPSGTSNVEYPAAADYIGIAFRARIGEDVYDDDATDSTQSIRFALPLSSTEADSDHYTKDLLITEEWTEYFVLWADADLIQQGFGEPAAFEPAKATALQFKLVNPASGFDLWVDDIRFVEAP